MNRNQKILLINGPNLNLLGIREPDIYGNETLKEIERRIEEKSKKMGFNLECCQFNSEGKIIDKIQEAYIEKKDYIIINPGGYTHYSVAIRDAITSVGIETIEVHLSDISKREDFRKISLISDVAIKTIMGHGSLGYDLALEFIQEKIEKKQEKK